MKRFPRSFQRNVELPELAIHSSQRIHCMPSGAELTGFAAQRRRSFERRDRRSRIDTLLERAHANQQLDLQGGSLDRISQAGDARMHQLELSEGSDGLRT